MKAKEQTIEVMYRKYKDKSGEILAVFPYVPHNRAQTLVACYVHVGQHCSAQMSHVMTATRPATPDEYADLHCELTQIYERTHFPRDPVFNLRIIKRRSSRRVAAVQQKAGE